MNVHWRKSINESKGKLEQKFDATFGTFFRIITGICFQRSKQKLCIKGMVLTIDQTFEFGKMTLYCCFIKSSVEMVAV
jgi:hypothetical protein